MFVSSQVWDTVVPILFTSFPLIGALLLLESASQRRKLEKEEYMAAFLIFGGFLLFVAWKGYYVVAIGGAIVFIGVFIHSLMRKHN